MSYGEKVEKGEDETGEKRGRKRTKRKKEKRENKMSQVREQRGRGISVVDVTVFTTFPVPGWGGGVFTM